MEWKILTEHRHSRMHNDMVVTPHTGISQRGYLTTIELGWAEIFFSFPLIPPVVFLLRLSLLSGTYWQIGVEGMETAALVMLESARNYSSAHSR
jgi:hypothetical protein